MKSNERQLLFNETDMLQGNVNRMCVSDSMDEVSSNYYNALVRLQRIFQHNFRRLHPDYDAVINIELGKGD